MPGVEDTAVAEACTGSANGLIRTTGSSRGFPKCVWAFVQAASWCLCVLGAGNLLWLGAVGSCCHCWLHQHGAEQYSSVTHAVLHAKARRVH